MKLNKIGIITINDENNYGNRLQNYAVHSVISSLGYTCETIAHQSVLPQGYKLKLLLKKLGCTIVPVLMQRKRPEILREFNFKNFTKRYIATKYYYNDSLQLSSDIIEKYDYFVVGSDQVWNPTFGNYNKIIDDMFLKFAKPKQKVCFAPSFGIDEIPSEWQSVFKENLSTFNNISVREYSGAKIVKELTGKEAEVLIDPTMMINKDEWLIISKPSKANTSKPYMLQYFLGNQNEIYKEQLEEISTRNNLSIYKLLDLSMPELYVAAPDEFIDLISKAALICTDSFHAVIFSILFCKPFIVFKRNDENVDMSSRIDNLLSMLKLEYRKCGNIENEDIFDKDYSHVPIILLEERNKSLNYLKEILK